MRLVSSIAFSRNAPLLGLLLCLPHFTFAMPAPILEFLINENSGTTVANTGTAGGTASRPSAYPVFSANVPVNGGVQSLDYGTTVNSNYYVQMTTPAALKSL